MPVGQLRRRDVRLRSEADELERAQGSLHDLALLAPLPRGLGERGEDA